MDDVTTDLLIIGAGPTGLFSAYYAGFRGLSVAVVDSLPELGGQITAMYPEKAILDVAGFPNVKGRDLVEGLVEQAATADPDVPARTARPPTLEHGDGRASSSPSTTAPRSRAKAVLITAGHRQVQPAAAAGRRRLGRARHGVLRAQLRAVRRQGRGHRRRRRQRVRLGPAPRADRQRRSPSSTAATRSAPTSAPCDAVRDSSVEIITRAQVTALRGDADPRGGRDHRRRRGAADPAGAGGGRRARLHRRPRRDPAVGARGRRSGTSSSTPRCAPTCRGSSPPATSPSTPARCG